MLHILLYLSGMKKQTQEEAYCKLRLGGSLHVTTTSVSVRKWVSYSLIKSVVLSEIYPKKYSSNEYSWINKFYDSALYS